MRGQPAHYLEHDELTAGNNYSYLKLSEKLKKDRKTKKKERTEERLRKRKYTPSNASTPSEQFFIICGTFFSWKRSDDAKRRQRRGRNKRKRLEIRQLKKNDHEELVQEKKTDNRRQPEKNCPLHAKKIKRSFTNSGAKQDVKKNDYFICR